MYILRSEKKRDKLHRMLSYFVAVYSKVFIKVAAERLSPKTHLTEHSQKEVEAYRNMKV